VSLFLPLRRASILIPSGPEGDQERKHLFILLTDPYKNINMDDSWILMVSLSTIRTGVPHDPTCILYVGDHPFIKHESYVFYQKARLENADKILRGIKSGQLIPQDPIDRSVFARVCKGLQESRLTPPKYLDFYLKATDQSG
jgi:hypothetical protein